MSPALVFLIAFSPRQMWLLCRLLNVTGLLLSMKASSINCASQGSPPSCLTAFFLAVSGKFNICYQRAPCALAPDSRNASFQAQQAGTCPSLPVPTLTDRKPSVIYGLQHHCSQDTHIAHPLLQDECLEPAMGQGAARGNAPPAPLSSQ